MKRQIEQRAGALQESYASSRNKAAINLGVAALDGMAFVVTDSFSLQLMSGAFGVVNVAFAANHSMDAAHASRKVAAIEAQSIALDQNDEPSIEPVD